MTMHPGSFCHMVDIARCGRHCGHGFRPSGAVGGLAGTGKERCKDCEGFEKGSQN